MTLAPFDFVSINQGVVCASVESAAMIELMVLMGLVAMGMLLGPSSSGDEADSSSDDAAENPDTPPPSDENHRSGGGETPGIVLRGGPEDDLLSGEAGDDTLIGNQGNDTLTGGAGNDRLLGGSGDDLLIGGAGDDTMFGGDGSDKMRGAAGNDEMYGGADDDLMFGGAGNDLMHGEDGDDVLEGGTGADTIFGGAGDDLIIGLVRADGQNVLQSSEALISPDDWLDDVVDPDMLSGGDGDDLIIMGRGDTAYGGAGADTFVVGPWMANSHEAGVVADFAAEEDNILILLPSTYAGAGDVVLDTDGEDALVQVDGALFARVSGAADTLTLEMVAIGTVEDLAG